MTVFYNVNKCPKNNWSQAFVGHPASSLMVIMNDDDERSPKDIRMAVHFKDEQCDEILSIYVTYFKNAAKYDEDGQSVEFD